MNLKSLLETTTQRYAGKAAIIQNERSVTYSELDEASNKVANALMKMSVHKGDRVAMLLSNSPEFVSVFFGIIKTGGIAVPLDTRYKAGELARIFNSCQPKVLIAENPCLEPLVPVLSSFKSIKQVISLSPGFQGKFLDYQQVMANNPASVPESELLPEDIVIINYTSAPTNHPRGATFTHRHVFTETKITSEWLQQTDKDVVMLFALPLYHMYGLGSVLLPAIYKGSRLVIVPGTGVSIGSLMAAIEKHKGTLLMGVPYIFALAVMTAEREGVKHDLSSLRLCLSGGAPLLVETIHEFKRYFGLTIADIWGLSEAVSQVSGPPLNHSWKIGSIGKALPGWEVKIVDDNGNELPPNQSGEMVVRGPVMQGYYNNPEATAKVLRNGWLHTGDIGKIDEDGYLYITGRKKRMLILKGQNVYPDDIEEVLLDHPKIAEVKVIGVPDKLRGEIVKAIIRLKAGVTATEQEIRYFCQERMADYKLPKQIEFIPSPAKTTT